MRLLAWLLLLSTSLSSFGKVVVISVDGLRSDAVTSLGAEELPNFYRLRTEGAFTDNARTDFDYTVTLPNHVSMITSRPVLGTCGHGLSVNSGGENTNIHASGYIPSMFDVAHDRGFSTALYATKLKFEVITDSYGEEKGAPDLIGEDNGRDKIDEVRIARDSTVIPPDVSVLNSFFNSIRRNHWDLTLLHFKSLDTVGHRHDWDVTPGSNYMEEMKLLDLYLARVFLAIESDEELNGKTHIILTSDHGGTTGTRTHTDPTILTNHRIPFYVWGPSVKAGGDLYQMNLNIISRRNIISRTKCKNIISRTKCKESCCVVICGCLGFCSCLLRVCLFLLNRMVRCRIWRFIM